MAAHATVLGFPRPSRADRDPKVKSKSEPAEELSQAVRRVRASYSCSCKHAQEGLPLCPVAVCTTQPPGGPRGPPTPCACHATHPTVPPAPRATPFFWLLLSQVPLSHQRGSYLGLPRMFSTPRPPAPRARAHGTRLFAWSPCLSPSLPSPSPLPLLCTHPVIYLSAQCH